MKADCWKACSTKAIDNRYFHLTQLHAISRSLKGVYIASYITQTNRGNKMAWLVTNEDLFTYIGGNGKRVRGGKEVFFTRDTIHQAIQNKKGQQ